jgi:hypothetical protein
VEEDHVPTEGDLAKAHAIIRGEGPLIENPTSPVVPLFRGYFDGIRFHADARVKELTGADEEAIARMVGASSPTQYMNAVLAYGVSQLGTTDMTTLTAAERVGLIDTLLVGEKEMLFLAILRVTYGDQREVTVKCTMCDAMNEVYFSITDDIPTKSLDDPQKPEYEFTLNNGDVITYRLVTGADQAEANRRPNISTPEENTIILSRVLLTRNGKDLVDPTKFVRNLGAGERRKWLRELTGKQPGPYFEEVKLPCATCGAESLFRPNWADLL